MGYLALDMSSWSGPFTDAEAEAAKAIGGRLVIVNTWGEWCRQQAETTLRHGLALEAYVYLYFDDDVEAQVRAALEAIRGLPVRMLWLDAEDDTMSVGAATIVEKLRRAEEIVTAWSE